MAAVWKDMVRVSKGWKGRWVLESQAELGAKGIPQQELGNEVSIRGAIRRHGV
jgi:hypothetical protein